MGHRGKGRRLRAPYPLALVRYVVHYDVVADLVRRGVEDTARVETGELVDKTAPVEIGPEHKGVDLDAALGAALHFFERFLDDPLVQQGGTPAAVQSPAAIESDRGRLAIGDEDDLPVGRPLGA